jgi:hypothetical protein
LTACHTDYLYRTTGRRLLQEADHAVTGDRARSNNDGGSDESKFLGRGTQ